MSWVTNRLPYLLAVVALGLAGAAGYFASSAIGQAPPAQTVTVDVATGPRGEPGPPGPPGPRGPAGLECPSNYEPGKLVINGRVNGHDGGQVSIWTCIGAVQGG